MQQPSAFTEITFGLDNSPRCYLIQDKQFMYQEIKNERVQADRYGRKNSRFPPV